MKTDTAQNTEISPNFLVLEVYENSAATVHFHKISKLGIR